jgi:Na+-driven multidrug efflux pump
LFALPLAYAGTVTPLGLWGVYLALVFETAIPAFVTYYRYHSGAWLAINRAYRAAQESA